MSPRKFRLLLTVLLMCLIVPSFGRASVCREAENKTYVFFANGMNNDQWDADLSAQSLEDDLLQQGNLDESGWSFELSYNYHESFFPQLLEVYRQRQGEVTTSFWRWLGNLDIAPEWFQDVTNSIVNTSAFIETVIDSDLAEHVTRYSSLLNEGNKIVVVAHSQGNLYSNLAYDRLSGLGMDMDAFGLVSVATPANHVAGGGQHFTLLNDRVINTVRLLYPGTLAGNMANTNDDGDWLHHDFVKAYLGGNVSQPLILNGILSLASQLSWHPRSVGSGLITVTLTWGSQPDVDLHIFEPDMSHVYYANKTGTSGSLDLDVTWGNGPEHYYVVDCASLQAGTYQVGVNYYRGYSPETANVQIQASDTIRNYSTFLPYSEGYYGDDSPHPVAYIDVVGYTSQGYTFTVRSQ